VVIVLFCLFLLAFVCLQDTRLCGTALPTRTSSTLSTTSAVTEVSTKHILLLSSSFFFLLSSQFTDEAERSLHDAISVVRRARKQSQSVVAGGGAIEMEVSKYLRSYSRTIHGKAQLIVNAYARALEVIPRTISQNAGLDSVDILNKLRHKHAQGGTWFGIDIETGGICDTYKSFVWEPTLV
jgi:hypothetical protein